MNGDELVKDLEMLRAENQRLHKENAALRKELAVAQEQVTTAREVFAQLSERLERLEGQIKRDSHNSSKPPSSDSLKQPVRKTQSLRGKSGKKSGGQVGHQDHTLMMVAQPDEVLVLAPPICIHCQQPLDSAQIQRAERAQVWDLPPLRLQVSEYQAQVKACPCCHQETRAAFPLGLQPAAVQYGPMTRALAVYLHCIHLLPYARTCQILSDVLGASFSQGSLQAALQTGSSQVQEALTVIKEGLMRSALIHNDETGFRVKSSRLWLHVTATSQLTYYQSHEKRGKEATDAIGILPRFHGISIHDSWACYLQYCCPHALCNAHYLRELTFIHEHSQQDWAKEMKALLLEIKATFEQARSCGQMTLARHLREQYHARYQELVEAGIAANPPPPRKKGTRGPLRGDDVRNLLHRLRDYQELILRFMHSFIVPFDNNLAERDLRMSDPSSKKSLAVFAPRKGPPSFVACAVICPPCTSKAFIF
ncbi:MAG TPA: IS66 family transposase [Ktedonosporobacter sp.]|nr:IS66 family transposase [Ktedonosporobacter sp.]